MRRKYKKKRGPVNSKKIIVDGITFASGLEKYMYEALKKAKIQAVYEGQTYEIFEGFDFPNKIICLFCKQIISFAMRTYTLILLQHHENILCFGKNMHVFVTNHVFSPHLPHEGPLARIRYVIYIFAVVESIKWSRNPVFWSSFFIKSKFMTAYSILWRL